jgi:hypothetical protein
MRKTALILTLVLVALLCCQCSTSQYSQAKKGAKDIPFVVLENYYVLNNVDCSKLQRLIIDNEQDFNSFFGPAALMGGMPTDINWRRQYVIALLLPVTNKQTMITPKEVKQSPGNVILYYQVNTGRKTQYTLVPFVAIALERSEEPQQLQVFYIEK